MNKTCQKDDANMSLDSRRKPTGYIYKQNIDKAIMRLPKLREQLKGIKAVIESDGLNKIVINQLFDINSELYELELILNEAKNCGRKKADE